MLMQFKGASEGCLAIFLFNNLWDSVPDYVLVVKGCKAQHIALHCHGSNSHSSTSVYIKRLMMTFSEI